MKAEEDYPESIALEKERERERDVCEESTGDSSISWTG